MDHKQKLKQLNRRKFIHHSVTAVAGAGIFPLTFSNCSPKEDPLPKFIAEGDYGFFEGVASFDPTQSNILLWTRYTPASNENGIASVLLEVSKDIAFKQIIFSESLEVSADRDFTVVSDVSNLTSNSKYYYRFRNEKTESVSVIGETATLPAPGEVTDIKFAFVSCANFEKGYFNVYGSIADSDAAFVVHLGDYIYEGANGSKIEGRIHEPPHELITLEDYRTRYRQYRGDGQLQELHRLKPFICIWDDHEFSNNSYKDGAGSHGKDDGDFSTRKSNAIQAWYEYLHARVSDQNKIYRKFDIAGFADLIMLDTRIIGRDRQLNYSDYIHEGVLDEKSFKSDWLDTQRTILGKEQLALLHNELNSGNTVKILGNQVLMEKHLIPAELVPIIQKIQNSGTITPDQRKEYYTLIEELIYIKSRMSQGDQTLTEQEKYRVENVLPYNLDSWDGYPVERKAIYNALGVGKKLFSIAGASHNAWYADLSNEQGNKIGAEFATSSITSSGLEGIFGDIPLLTVAIEQANVAMIDDVQYVNASQRGFVTLNLSKAGLDGNWYFVDTISEKDTNSVLKHQAFES